MAHSNRYNLRSRLYHTNHAADHTLNVSDDASHTTDASHISDTSDASTIAFTEERYEVEQILDYRVNDGGVEEWLVKWENWDAEWV